MKHDFGTLWGDRLTSSARTPQATTRCPSGENEDLLQCAVVQCYWNGIFRHNSFPLIEKVKYGHTIYLQWNAIQNQSDARIYEKTTIHIVVRTNEYVEHACKLPKWPMSKQWTEADSFDMEFWRFDTARTQKCVWAAGDSIDTQQSSLSHTRNQRDDWFWQNEA